MQTLLFLAQSSTPSLDLFLKVLVDAPVLAMLFWLMKRQDRIDIERAKQHAENVAAQLRQVASTDRLARMIGQMILLNEMAPRSVHDDIKRSLHEIGDNP